TKCKFISLLSGILMMIALYSINLRIMGKSNISLSDTTLFKQVESKSFIQSIDTFINNGLSSLGITGLPKTWSIVIMMIFITLAIKLLIDYFLKTDIGLALRATGDDVKLIGSF